MKTIVPENWAVPVSIRDRFGESAGRQRAMVADGHLLLVLHEPPDLFDRERKACLLWRDPAGTWAWTGDGDTTQLLKKHLARFTEILERLDDTLQEASSAADYFNLLRTSTPLYRTSRNLHTALQSAREALPEDRDIIAARDAASDIERAFELLQMDAKNGLDFMVARKTELQTQRGHEMAVSAHRLNCLAAIFFPVTALSSIFGMKFSSGLEPIAGTWLFWLILATGATSGLLLTFVINNRPDCTDDQTQPTQKLANGVTKTKRKAMARRDRDLRSKFVISG